MSRIGKKPIPLPPQTEVRIDGQTVIVKGAKGELRRVLRPEMRVRNLNGSVVVERKGEDKVHRSLHGLSRTLVANMVHGVTTGFTTSLEIMGVGYRASMQGTKLVLSVGYSHPVEIVPPPGISISVEEKANRIHVSGADKEMVGNIGARIRRVRPAEPYKGKGIRYLGELIRKKAGKAGGKKK